MIHIPKFLAKMGILPLKTVEFVQKQLTNSSRKKILVDSWLSVKHLSYNLRELLERLPSGPPITFYVGKHDPVISANQIQSISDRIPISNCITLNDDHNKVRYSALAKIFNS